MRERCCLQEQHAPLKLRKSSLSACRCGSAGDDVRRSKRCSGNPFVRRESVTTAKEVCEHASTFGEK